MSPNDSVWRLLLVPTDFSRCSDEALRFAAKIARQNRAKLIALHVSELTSGLDLNTTVQPDGCADPLSVEEYLRRSALKKIQEQATRILGVFPFTPRVAFGPIAITITDQARLEGADLLVLGTHGHTDLRRLLIGSVAERVVRTAPIPVLVVRHPAVEAEETHTQAENTLLDEGQG